ncbi:Putative odorant receptor 13a [Trachymyrmex zeteki]|uniref:Odorant receptor n=1 Tax=Mycetomoellerius zeteki TaxID=64791 RepID=A0A151X7T6_9HYME|nr:Putative odorant receptor 13a [Trachymyrmex zeteki]
MNSNYYGVVKKVSSLVGQWPYQNPKTKLIYLSFVTLSTFSIVIPQLAKFVICDGDMQCIFQTMAAHMLTIITLVKLYTCHLNRYKMKVLIDRVFLEWDELETPEEYEIMKRYAENGRRYSLGYSLYCFISAFLFLCISLIPPLLDTVLPLNESRPILSVHPGYYFVDEKEYFFYIFWHAVVVWEIAVTGIVAHDCMLLTYIEHVCSIFALGGFRFERLMYKCNEYESDTITVLHSHARDTFRKRIAFSVYTHRKALKFAQLIEDIFSITLALQIALNTVMISITLLQIKMLYFSYCMEITQHNASVFIVVRYVVYVLSQLIHLFCLSFEGQKLIDHSLQTRDKILWYETAPKSQRMLLFVMQKALQPVFLSACKIYIFSRENFTMVKIK